MPSASSTGLTFAIVQLARFFSLASRRSFRTFTGQLAFEVRFRYNLPSCQAFGTNLPNALSISLFKKGHPYLK
ncbi:MAG: hypothetical protein KDD43_15440 [Bdellovibrionales bacterium]|nr:hypothetical protein [Bdellovibrionales bacterium]